jgi:hypothetical protein
MGCPFITHSSVAMSRSLVVEPKIFIQIADYDVDHGTEWEK